jgi:3-oxoacyl-[acyl-carrier protein] reductase
MDLNLKDKVALVTGGGTGIGAGISRVLAEEGANVAVNYIVDEEQVRDFVQSLNDRYQRSCTAVYGDISKGEDIDRMIETILSTMGRLDFLVNNAGIWPTDEALDMPDESWKRVIEVNLNGPFMVSMRFARQLVKSGSRGKIVNVSSKSAFQVTTGGHTHYATAKAGINMLTQSLARELSEKGIIVSGVAPGIVRTPLNEEKFARLGQTEYYMKRLPLGRFAEPEEIGYLVAFLLSDKSDNINGTIVDTTGGMLI